MLGAIIGDIVGSRFEVSNHKNINFELFHSNCNFTDDTICTVAVADWLIKEEGKQNDFANHLQKWCLQFSNPMGGYGTRFASWIREKHPKPYGSYGNGSAMRIAPVGWSCESLDETCSVAGEIAAVSHNHPEGIKGAQATASAIFLARKGFSKIEIRLQISQLFGYNLNRTCEEIRPVYEYNETCQGTVPEAIVAFLDSTDFENAIRLAVSLGGDSDTLTCITGAIAEAFYGIPYELENEALSYLPENIMKVITLFKNKYEQQIDDVKYFSQIRVTPHQIWEKMFELIPLLEKSETANYTHWGGGDEQPDGTIAFPYPIYNDLVRQWEHIFEESKLMIPFAWSRWIEPKKIHDWSEVDYERFSAVEICKIFTALIRAERFSDGSIRRFFREGNMLKCLKVLSERINQSKI